MKESGPNIPGSTSPEKIRISISNLVNSVRIRETGKRYQIVMRNKKTWDEKGQAKYQALGGAAKMTPEGKEKMIATYGAEFAIPGRPNEEADDARFFVPTAPDALMDSFSTQDTDLFEADVLRETHEDLMGILTDEEFKSIDAHYEGAVSPVRWKTTTSERETGIPSKRIFHLFELDVSEAIFNKLQQADSLRVLSDSDVEDINAATAIGNPAAPTKDGSIIVENVFPEV